MDYQWIIHGLSMDYPWIINGSSMDYLWIIHRLSMDYPWIIHGLSMDYPWIIYGLSTDGDRMLVFPIPIWMFQLLDNSELFLISWARSPYYFLIIPD